MDTSINPDIVNHVDDKPDEPEGPHFQQDVPNHIKTDAIRVDAIAEDQMGVGDIATEMAMDNVLREADLNQEPADVYMPKVLMDDIHGKYMNMYIYIYILLKETSQFPR